jgi:hypothetical protein
MGGEKSILEMECESGGRPILENGDEVFQNHRGRKGGEAFTLGAFRARARSLPQTPAIVAQDGETRVPGSPKVFVGGAEQRNAGNLQRRGEVHGHGIDPDESGGILQKSSELIDFERAEFVKIGRSLSNKLPGEIRFENVATGGDEDGKAEHFFEGQRAAA